MNHKDLNLSKRVQSKDIYNCLIKNFNLLSADWVYHQWNWLHQNYDAFNDLIKYFISISLIRNTFRIYQENGFQYNYDEYYSRDEIQIGEFNISELAKEFDLPITISGLAALTTFSFKSENALAYKTFITQEMLKKATDWIDEQTSADPDKAEKPAYDAEISQSPSTQNQTR